ncbi:proton-translocating nadh-quinone oxidoreductase subunit m : Proton-translocating NADH-quinone oxidoreductase, chain M OS=Singulisphaera acidiphila (strain ATCC BAA-1392 / DSM 18658 / VKM B-2454 / MOB10) GN=Sinac_1360 PE=4 SV=1: Oxidored_q5_N: Oxidored_q1: Oxidored_q1 [Gemmata massiliana]|uniref:NADH:quinone oxidoreductase/Mrp antiporter membrane subunit domain-containing protein n=1 Tax=Gemmata massiliana TaxID=1210884 RepID=A0A6P2D3J0_9BACT|nr:NADH-quinone oxidoreductase subunit M [Gemmata massiliana]VTR95888.1 proton-translocating nadh-quinone oxidoreductase subunit m : Proton-translocating NADH-quinone oxidoreductase, chain M OS=Singulisphaera acidiphila (strain ATCC BAA-1392 / DSM 18658 / VKM B-2454 / MOB10) GN=Sinac_1360 PE=4 SV=1: Oxidored_q5_N: Oxidored_q1: Oxidored_q1 [Gemmata massiliana]
MPETDLTWLSILVFLPAVCAAGLFVFPSKWTEGMRWWATFGAAGTLSIALCVVVGYYNLLDRRLDANGKPGHSVHTRLDNRADKAASDAAQPIPKKLDSDDWVARRAWISIFNIQYALGVDGISLPLVVLTALVVLLAIVASWNIQESVRGYLALILLLETGVIGAFLALDFFLFYVSYELMLLPMYVLIGLWGGGNRKFAALKFVIYTLLGGVCLLVAMLALYSVNARDFVDQAEVKQRALDSHKKNPHVALDDAANQVEVHTFDFVTLSKAGRAAALVLSGQEDRLAVKTAVVEEPNKDDDPSKVKLFAPGVDRDAALARLKSQPVCTKQFQYFVFALLFLGFAVKVPIVPLHSWLPDAHVEAPTPVSMILAGVLLKLGGYGLIRVAFPVCPWAAAELAWWVGLVGVVSIVYGALVAMGQTDFKKLLAYSSVSHMGFVVLGLASWGSATRSQYWQWGVDGAMFQMVAHGITASALFFIVGVVYDRAHHRDLNRFGGLKEPMPLYAGLSAILFFASMGLPGLCGFVGEFCVFMGAWNFSPALAVPAVASVILTAAYLLWTWQRVYFGTNPATKDFPELSPREAVCLLPFALLAIGLGVVPSLLLFNWMDPSVAGWIENMAPLKP